MPGSHTYVDRDTPENERIKFHGISEGKETIDNVIESAIKKYIEEQSDESRE